MTPSKRKKRSSFESLQVMFAGFDAEMFLQEIVGVTSWDEKPNGEMHMSCPLPFGLHAHGDKNPSASFNRDKMLFNCFGCQSGGDVVWLTQTMMDLEHHEDAVRALKAFFSEERVDFEQEMEMLWADDVEELQRMPSYSAEFLKPWKRFSDYFTARGVTEEVQRRMSTGVALNNRDYVDKVYYEQPRVAIPHFFREKLRGWQLRKIADHIQVGPKYKSSPKFPKKLTLYNYDASLRHSSVIVVESPMSVLRMMSVGIDNVVATFGSPPSEGQKELLRSWDEVTVMYDGDYAGNEGTHSMVKGLEDHADVRIATFPIDSGLDPGDLRVDVDELHRMVRHAESSVTWGGHEWVS